MKLFQVTIRPSYYTSELILTNWHIFTGILTKIDKYFFTGIFEIFWGNKNMKLFQVTTRPVPKTPSWPGLCRAALPSTTSRRTSLCPSTPHGSGTPLPWFPSRRKVWYTKGMIHLFHDSPRGERYDTPKKYESLGAKTVHLSDFKINIWRVYSHICSFSHLTPSDYFFYSVPFLLYKKTDSFL